MIAARFSSIRIYMRCSWAVVRIFSLGLIVAITLLPVAVWGTAGVFQGTVIDPPTSVPASPGWIFVEGRNHMLRRVEVSHAQIEFGSAVPASERHSCRMECLEVGQEIRVIANQDKSGEWRAERVEILHLTTGKSQTST